MKFSCELFFLSVVVLVQTSSAQDLTKYFEVGKKLTLETNVSAITKPIRSITWKYGSSLVVDWTSPDILKYFGPFKGRTTLDTDTLRLDIDRVTLADSGSFSLETNSGPHETYKVIVIKPPPTPSIKTQPLVCEVTCALKCTTDTQDLGPVTYQWKMDEGEWTQGDELKSISSSDTTEKFFCRLRTLVRTSEASTPMRNPFNKPVVADQDSTKYLEVGQKLTLETDVSAIPKPIRSITWKYGSNLVVDWTSPNHLMYFGSFRGRTTLDTQTLRLDIDRVTLADSGSFSLETNSGPYGTYNVKVIKPPPTPSIKPQPLVCEVTCALKCTADTQDLGPVTYQWKMDEGEWTQGVELKSISSSDTTEKFFCRLRTRVRTSETSMPMVNPF